MIQILSKIVKAKTSLNSLDMAPMGFLLSRSRHFNLLKPMKAQALLFAFILALCGSTNAFAADKGYLLNKPTLSLNHPFNAPPVAMNDSLVVDEDNMLSGSVATNDMDPDGDALTYTVTSSLPSNKGTIALLSDGSFMFMPFKDFSGIVEISYKVCDPSSTCATAKLVIKIRPVNDPPKAAQSTIVSTPKNKQLLGDLKPRVIDIDNLISSLRFAQLQTMAVNEGTIVLSTNGAYVYTPPPGFFGVTGIIYEVCDPSNACDTASLVISVKNVNEPPVPQPDNISTSEDTPLTGSVATNDSDPDNPNTDLTFTMTSTLSPSVGTIVFNPDGSYTFRPFLNYTGTVVINYQVCDLGPLCVPSTLTINVTPVNDPPVVTVTNPTVPTTEDTPKPGDLKPLVTDPDNPTTTLTFTPVGTIPTTQGTFTLNPDGTYTFSPAPNFTGPVVVTYQACDPSKSCTTGTVTFNVSPVNDKPVITPVAPSTTTPEDKAVTVCTTIVDPDQGDVLSATICGVNNGGAVPTITGTQLCVVYTPTANYNGPDTVCVKVCDNLNVCDTLKIPIVVTPINDPPSVTQTTLTTEEDTKKEVCTTINDVDLGDAFRATLCGVKNGTAAAVITGKQICVTYTPTLNYSGLDTICFVVTDLAGAFDTLRIPVVVTPVNDKPIAKPTSMTTDEDVPAVVCTPISDVDDTDLSIDLCTSLAKNGDASAEILGNEVCMTYSPNPNFSGKDTVCIIVCDLHGACDTLNIPVVVIPVNDPPTVDPVSISTLEDTPAKVCTTINDIDLGETFNTTPCGVKNGIASAVIKGNEICVTYTPKLNYNGVDTVCFNVCDLGGACVILEIPVVVTPVNDKPIVTPPTPTTTPEETQTTICTTIADGDLGETFKATLCSVSGAKNGTATASIKTSSDAAGTQLCVTYLPKPNYNGVDTICVTVCDATDSCVTVKFPVNVTPVNDAPTVTPLSIPALEDIPVTLCTTINDVDLGDTFTYTTCGTKNGGTATAVITGNQLCVTYTSKLDYNGLDTACFTICDAANACVKIEIPVVVSPVSDKPVVTPTRISTQEDTPATICTTINDSDLGDIFAATACAETAKNGKATAVITGTKLCVTYEPNLNFSGLDTICYTVCDLSGNCDVVKIPVVVTPINDPPTVTPTSILTKEDKQETVCTTINDVDLNEIFKATLCGVKNGTADLTVLDNQLCVTYTPNLNFNGVDTVCVTVCDKGDACTIVKIPVVVTPVNDKPIAVPTSMTTDEDVPAVVCTPISDVDDTDLSIELCVSLAKKGEATGEIVGNTVCMTYSPYANVSGKDTVCILVCDLNGVCDTLSIPVVIMPLNDAPTVVQTTISTLEDKPATVCTKISDVDLGETFTAKLCNAPIGGIADAIIAGNDICVTYTPKANFNGVDTICFAVCDIAKACDTLKIPVVVEPVNDAPTVTPVAKILETLEDASATVCTTINDVDLGEIFKATLCDVVKNGDAKAVITDNKICVTYTPKANYNGVDTICFKVCDAANVCDTLKIPVVVTPVNDKPVVNPLSISTSEDTAATVCTTILDPDLGEIFTAAVCGEGKKGATTLSLVDNKLCVTYTPKPNLNGKDSICIKVCDVAKACDTLKIPVTIKAVNDTPVVVVVPFVVLRNDTRELCFDIDDKDANDIHKATLCGLTLVGSSAVVSVSNGQVCITYTTLAGYLGADTICLIVCDSSNACTQVKIPVMVTDCDDQLPPVLACPDKIEVNVLGKIISDPSKFINQVTFSDNCDGLNFTFNKLVATDDCGTPTVRQLSGLTKDSVFIVGKHYLRFEAKDVSDKTTPCQVEIMVSPVEFVDATKLSVCPGETLSLKAKEFNGATYKWTGPRNTSIDSVLLTVPRTASESVEMYNLAATFGACTFRDSINVTFRVRPVVNNDLFTVAINSELKNSVLTNDTTITLSKYTVKLDKPAKDGKISFNPDGTFTYNPSTNFTGTEIFTYEVCPLDCPNTCERATATIKVFNAKFANRGTNVITPNNDGLNDALEIEGNDPNAPNNKSEIVIYNQWGNTVYHATSYKNDWRGTFNENPLPVGTYYFVFRKTPDAVPLKDFVTIIR
jgi:large repetitive protein